VRASFVRVLMVMPTQTGGNTSRIAEVEVYGTAIRHTEVALGRPATGSAPCKPTETPDKVVDGVISAAATWCSTAWL
jgi:hypothetical protein